MGFDCDLVVIPYYLVILQALICNRVFYNEVSISQGFVDIPLRATNFVFPIGERP